MSQWIGSPNFYRGRDGTKIDSLVIHWIVGNLASADSIFQNRTVNTSAHYGVEEGNVHQYVKEEDTAFHAGNWNFNLRSIGIEHSAAPGRPASDGTYESSARLIADICKRRGISLSRTFVRRHGEIVATQCCGDVSVERLIARAAQIMGQPAPAPAPAPSPAPAQVKGTATVTGAVVNVRSAPNVSAPLAGSRQLTQGQTFKYVEAVRGQNVDGVSTWLKSEFGNYVWAGALSYATTPLIPNRSGTVNVIVDTLNARTAPNTQSPVGAQFHRGTAHYNQVTIGETVTVAGKTSNVWLLSDGGRWFAAAGTDF